MWQILQPINPNVTPINAPYRVRVIEMVIEVIFGESVNVLNSTFTMLQPQILNFSHNKFQSTGVRTSICLMFKVHETLLFK